MNRKEKIEQLKGLQSGKVKPLDLINFGFWLWNLKDGVYSCEVLNWEHLKLNHQQWLKFCEGGGTHLVFVKTYASGENTDNKLNNLIRKNEEEELESTHDRTINVRGFVSGVELVFRPPTAAAD